LANSALHQVQMHMKALLGMLRYRHETAMVATLGKIGPTPSTRHRCRKHRATSRCYPAQRQVRVAIPLPLK
jgi:hypothetical protein